MTIPVERHRQDDLRVVRLLALAVTMVGRVERGQIHMLNRVQKEPDEMVFVQPILHARRQQIQLPPIARGVVVGHPLLPIQDGPILPCLPSPFFHLPQSIFVQQAPYASISLISMAPERPTGAFESGRDTRGIFVSTTQLRSSHFSSHICHDPGLHTYICLPVLRAFALGPQLRDRGRTESFSTTS